AREVRVPVVNGTDRVGIVASSQRAGREDGQSASAYGCLADGGRTVVENYGARGQGADARDDRRERHARIESASGGGGAQAGAAAHPAHGLGEAVRRAARII